MAAGSSTEILRTKLYRPRPPERLVKRRRLFQRLDEGVEQPLTVVSAPAGYGKTMLVSSWLTEGAQPACWLSLDGGDDDLGIFLSYLVAAVQTVYPLACSGAASLLQAVDPPPAAVMQTHLLNELDQLPGRLTIVLDDYHLIRSPEIHTFITNLVNRMPAGLHLVVSSRELPPLPLNIWRSKMQVNEIHTRDLRFTLEEADLFLKNCLRLPLSAETFKMIQDKAEGWVAGLQLAAFSLRSAIDPLKFVASFQKSGSETIREFLLDQAFRNQPQPIQEFLLKTSILERFCAPLCNALGLSGENLRSTQDTISILRRTNLYIVPVDDEGKWYRYHNLFAEMLQRRLKALYDRDEVTELHRRAVEWFETQAMIDDAVKHALHMGDFLLAAEIVERHSIQALNLELNAMIDRWLTALPAQLIETRPRLMMMRVWIESYREHGLSMGNTAYIARAQTLLDTRAQEMDAETRTLLDGYVSALRPHYLINIGNFELGVSLAEHALETLPAYHHYVRGRALMGWALCMQATGRGSEAINRLLAERDLQTEVNSYSLVVYLALACLYAMSGKLDELQQAAASLYTRAQTHGYQILTGWADYLLGLAAYIGNDLSTAREHYQTAVNLRYLISKSIVREALVGLCLTEQAMGNPVQAGAALDQLNELEGGEVNEYQRSLRARLALSRDDLVAAQNWSLAEPFALPSCLFAWLELPHFTQARLWVKQGSPESLTGAADLLRGLIGLAERRGSTWRVIDGKIWLACALYKLGKRSAACETLQEAVQLAQPRSFVRLFVDAGSQVAEMIQLLGCRDSAFCRRILAALPHAGPATADHPLLTRRELEVLGLLGQHLSEREIAGQISVSLDTVKKHCYHIYNKLGVNNRREALAAARQLGLLL